MIDIKPLEIVYTNHKKKTNPRSIIPKDVYYGTTKYHTEPQWLMVAIDVVKGEERTFAMNDMLISPNQRTIRKPKTVAEQLEFEMERRQ